MSRAGWLNAAMIVLALASGPARGQTSGNSTAPDPVDLAQSCTRPGNSPVCAYKTYLACVIYDAPALCKAIGLDGVAERFPGPDTTDSQILAAPWTLAFERLLPEAFALHLYDAGPVTPARFTGAAGPIPSGELYELVLDIPEPYVKGLVYRQSAFFRRTGENWQLAAWSSSRTAACNAATATWGPCRWFLKNLTQREVFAAGVKQIWAAPKLPGHEDYPHPGLELSMGMPNQPVVAPFGGTIVRRALKYPDTPLYDWVVIQGEGARANMTVKFALVDRSGPPAGTHVDAAAPLGKPQWVEAEHPGAGKFIHIELLRDGLQIDPRSVMRERKAQELEH